MEVVAEQQAVASARRAMWPLLGAASVLAASNSVFFPLLAQLQDAYGLPTWGLGLISGTGFLVGLVVQLTVAGFADRGYARVLLLSSLGVSVAGGLLFAASSSLTPIVIARALGGFSAGCFIPAARAMAASVDRDHVAHHLGRLASFELVGFVIGPVVGAALSGPLGLRWPFVVFAGLALAALVALAGRRLPSLPTGEASSRPSLELLRNRAVLVAALVALALFLPVGVYDALWARYLEDRGTSTLFVGLSFTLYGIPFALLAARGGRIADRVGAARAALLTLIAVAPITALYGLLRWPLVIVSVAIVESCIQALAVPAAQAAMAKATPPGRLAAGQGLAGATQLAGASAVAMGAAPLYAAAGPEVVFVTAGALIAVIGVIAALLHRASAR
ncbi:MAG TPA: MFS transporter [Acidimicrobiales bacterium]